MVSQNRRIDQLVEKIQQQQDKLEKQSVHLQALQSKVRFETACPEIKMTHHLKKIKNGRDFICRLLFF